MRLIAIVILSCFIQGAFTKKRGKCARIKKANKRKIGANNLKRFDCANGTGRIISPGCKRAKKKQLKKKYAEKVDEVRTTPGKCIECDSSFILNEGVCRLDDLYNDMRLGCEYDSNALGCAASQGMKGAGFSDNARLHNNNVGNGRIKIALVVERTFDWSAAKAWVTEKEYPDFTAIMEGYGRDAIDAFRQNHFQKVGILDDFAKNTGIEFEIFPLDDKIVRNFSAEYHDYIAVTFIETTHRCYSYLGQVFLRDTEQGHHSDITFYTTEPDGTESEMTGETKPQMTGQLNLAPFGVCWGDKTSWQGRTDSQGFEIEPITEGYRSRAKTLEHELLHALGIMHEFDRSDTWISWRQAGQTPIPTYEDTFFHCYKDTSTCPHQVAYGPYQVDYGPYRVASSTPYDFESLMNYNWYFSEFTNDDTRKMNPAYRIYTEEDYWPKMSKWDVFEVNKAYNLKSHCASRGLLWAFWDYATDAPFHTDHECFPVFKDLRGADTCIAFNPDFFCHSGVDEDLKNRLDEKNISCHYNYRPRCVYHGTYTIPHCHANKYYRCKEVLGYGFKRLQGPYVCQGNQVYSSKNGRCVGRKFLAREQREGKQDN